MTLRSLISWTAWPVLLILCLIVTAIGFMIEQPFHVMGLKLDPKIVIFNLTYIGLALSLLFLERRMPHEIEWTKSDGQIWSDIFHTLVSKGTVQTLIVFSTTIGLSNYVTSMDQPGYGIWPRHWPLWAQVILGVVTSEFGLYWAHHIAHKWKPLWRFHAIHHSVKKLWIVNTGRFHFIDSLKSILLGTGILLSLGAPMEVITWLAAITAYIGILTHCNVDMKFGWISYVFNTPELHRWHHSKDLREGDKNFGENIMLWDWVFCTWFHEGWRRPPVDIGIKDEMPPRFRDQLAYPFRRPYPTFLQWGPDKPEAAE